MMTRKDYERAVKVIQELSPSPGVDFTIYAFATFFEEDNPRFDRDRFVKACKGETGIRGGKP